MEMKPFIYEPQKIAADFMSFPFVQQYEIAISLNVVKWDDSNLSVADKLVAWAKRIRAEAKVERLVNKMNEIREREQIKKGLNI